MSRQAGPGRADMTKITTARPARRVIPSRPARGSGAEGP